MEDQLDVVLEAIRDVDPRHRTVTVYPLTATSDTEVLTQQVQLGGVVQTFREPRSVDADRRHPRLLRQRGPAPGPGLPFSLPLGVAACMWG